MPNLAKTVYKRFFRQLLPEPLQFRLRFRYKIGYWPRVEQPRSMIEKIFWLIRFDRSPIRRTAADRVAVRQYVATCARDCKMPGHLWTGSTFGHDVWDRLPARFVLKANHGSQMTLLVDKAIDRYEAIVGQSCGWMDTDYSKLLDEWVYAEVPRLLIAEERLSAGDGAVPADWKFFCGNGRVLMVVVDLDRFGNHRRNLYWRDFTRIVDGRIVYDGGPEVDRPAAYDKAVEIAEQLASGYDFIRVDLYVIGDDVYFGELTNFPAAGWDAIEPDWLDFKLGSMVRLQGIDGSHVTESGKLPNDASH